MVMLLPFIFDKLFFKYCDNCGSYNKFRIWTGWIIALLLPYYVLSKEIVVFFPENSVRWGDVAVT